MHSYRRTKLSNTYARMHRHERERERNREMGETERQTDGKREIFL